MIALITSHLLLLLILQVGTVYLLTNEGYGNALRPQAPKRRRHVEDIDILQSEDSNVGALWSRAIQKPPGVWGRELELLKSPDSLKPKRISEREVEFQKPPGVWGREIEHQKPPGVWGREIEHQKPPGVWGRDVDEFQKPPGVWGREVENQKPPGVWGREVEHQKPPGVWGRELEEFQKPPGVWGRELKILQVNRHKKRNAAEKLRQDFGEMGLKANAAERELRKRLERIDLALLEKKLLSKGRKRGESDDAKLWVR